MTSINHIIQTHQKRQNFQNLYHSRNTQVKQSSRVRAQEHCHSSYIWAELLPSRRTPLLIKISRGGRGAQWAKSGGEAVLLQLSDFTKEPLHDFNRLFCWGWVPNREHGCVVIFIIFIKYFIFMSFDIGRRRVLIRVKYMINMNKNAPARWHCKQNIWFNLL